MTRNLLLAISIFFISSVADAADYFSWQSRTDRDGKPAGVFTTTPFPVTEASTEYSITTDEGTKTYQLGTKLYVAKTGSDEGANDCQTFGTPCLTIAYAITQTSVGTNQTIIVRDGTYEESDLTPKTGAGDLARSMIIGYSQERPVIDGGNSAANKIVNTTGATNAYVTLQRLTIQNTQQTGVRLGTAGGASKQDNYFSLVDVELTNCANNTGAVAADGLIYWLNADYAWAYHVTAHRTMGHCLKIGDDSDNPVVEWSVVYECGYWSTILSDKSIVDWDDDGPGTHPSGVDITNDAGEITASPIVRYNTIYDTNFYGLNLENAQSMSVHHNEVYNTPHFDDVGSQTGATGSPQVLFLGDGSNATDSPSGNFYSNLIRDSSDATSSGASINSLKDGYTLNLYNNVIYNNPLAEIYLYGFLSTPGSTRVLKIINNTLDHNSATTQTIEAAANWAASEVSILNNIVVQRGSAATLELDNDISWDYNLYYFPSGSLGETAGANDYDSGSSTDPLFAALLSGTYSWGDGNLQSSSPARNAASDQSGIFTDSFNGVTRVAWDIGAHEFFLSNFVGCSITGGTIQ